MSPEDRADFVARCERAIESLMVMADTEKGAHGHRLRGKASGVALALSYLRGYPEVTQ